MIPVEYSAWQLGDCVNIGVTRQLRQPHEYRMELIRAVCGRRKSNRMSGSQLEEDSCDQTQERKNYSNGNDPPKRADSSGKPSIRAKFSSDVILVVEGFIGQVQAVGVCFLGPSGRFTGTAFWAGFRVAGNVCAAVWTCVGSHRINLRFFNTD